MVNQMQCEPPPLFCAGDAEDAAYRNLRDEVSEPARVCKLFTEELWAVYYPYADPHFLTEIRRDYYGRFWEMYLTCALLDHLPKYGYAVSCPKPGPDVLVERDGRRIWIEAIVATDGDPAKPDSVVQERSGTIPDVKITLRYTNAVATKHQKYLDYRNNGIIAAEDAYVIAVNGYPLSYKWSDPEIPRILKAVFPLGAFEVVLDRKTREVTETRHQFRPSIQKTSGVAVPTEIFVREEFRGISAVMHSYANAYMTKAPLGLDFLLVHNPLASSPVALGTIPATREYRAVPVDQGYELQCHAGAIEIPE